MIEALDSDWTEFLQSELEKPYIAELKKAVSEAYELTEVYPPLPQVFRAFNLCSPFKVKVIVIGQDPYHSAGQAHGLCFSVADGVKPPPSLKNIYAELKEDVPDFKIPQAGNLEAWAKQGVLLLNAVLTVQGGKPGSHKSFGWEKFTDAVIRTLSETRENLVFLLWGNYAISKSVLIDKTKHLVLTAAHPSPLARGAFFGCKHFSKTNKYLVENGLPPINWSLT